MINRDTAKTLLIVEDDKSQLRRYGKLAQTHFNLKTASSYEEALQEIKNHKIDVLLTDIHLSTGLDALAEGFDLIAYAKKVDPSTLSIVMTSDPSIETYETSFEKGALAFLKKPIVCIEELISCIEAAKRNVRLKDDSIEAEARGLILEDRVKKYSLAVAKSPTITSVIYGETGTGKEEIAKFIHRLRVKFEGKIPFVAVNCANLDSNMASSILFGHRRGSFTGADQTTTGLVGDAHGGILFLDEVHHLNKECQGKLLRVLNDGTYQKLGDTQTLQSNFQVIAASTRDLDEVVEEGGFLLDLRSRLIGIDLELKPLRSRFDELTDFINLFCEKEGITLAPDNLRQIVEKCQSYYWQGNIRQLFNVLKAFHTLCSVYEQPFDMTLFPEMKSMYAPKSSSSSTLRDSENLSDLLFRDAPLKETLFEVEHLILKNAIQRHGSKKNAKIALDIGDSTFYCKLSKHKL